MASKLLCATDGSKSAQQAITFSVNLAKKENASLTFLNVNNVSPERASRTYFWDQEILDAAAIQVHKVLGAAMDSATKAGLKNASCVTVSGSNVAEAISSYAKEHGIDQIIIGSHGRRGAAAVLLGSVASGVASTAHCPVTIVR
jgi:nucleotide-binding universal stress UspA family protein